MEKKRTSFMTYYNRIGEELSEEDKFRFTFCAVGDTAPVVNDKSFSVVVLILLLLPQPFFIKCSYSYSYS